jgi:hypothetical protein
MRYHCKWLTYIIFVFQLFPVLLQLVTPTFDKQNLPSHLLLKWSFWMMDKLGETSLKTSPSFLLSERPPVPHIHVPSSLCLMIIMSEAKRSKRIVKWITVYRILLQNTNHSQHLVYFLGLPCSLRIKLNQIVFDRSFTRHTVYESMTSLTLVEVRWSNGPLLLNIHCWLNHND